MKSKTLVLSLLLCGVVSSGTSWAQAQAYPTRPVRLIIAWGPGSSTDVTGRIVSQKLSENLGETIVVDNRPGAEGVIAAEILSRAIPDGYTIMLGSNSTHGSHAVFRKLPYDPVKDFEPVARLSTNFYILVAGAGMKVNSVKDLVALAKSDPGKRMLANTGGISYLTGELFKHTAGVDMVAVPYKTVAMAFADLFSGNVDALFQSPPSVGPQIKAGRLKALAVTAAQRSKLIPDVPTVAEMGYPGFESVAWIAFFAPAHTPQPIVRKLSQEIGRTVRSADVRQKIVSTGTSESQIVGGSPEELRDAINAEIAKWRRLSQVAHIQTQ